MWHDGDRWRCLCGWQPDWLIADAMDRAKVVPEKWETKAGDLSCAVRRAFGKLGEVGPRDVVLAKTKGGEWRTMAPANLQGGRCGCCDDGFPMAEIVELRRVRITVEDR
jgi:hypothetical protein